LDDGIEDGSLVGSLDGASEVKIGLYSSDIMLKTPSGKSSSNSHDDIHSSTGLDVPLFSPMIISNCALALTPSSLLTDNTSPVS